MADFKRLFLEHRGRRLFYNRAEGLEEAEVGWVAGGQAGAAGVAGLNRGRRPASKHGWVLPPFDLGVSVREGESAGIVMIGGRAIDPLIDAGDADEGAVVNADGVFIDEDPEAGGAGLGEGGFFVIRSNGGGVRVGNDVAEPGVHGHAAHMGISLAEETDAALIGRAFINSSGIHVGIQKAHFDPGFTDIQAVDWVGAEHGLLVLASGAPLGEAPAG